MNPFGPLFGFEMRRLIRKNRPFLARSTYAALMLVMVGLIYLSLFPRGPDNFSDFLFRSDNINRKDLATFGEIFLSVFVVIQFIIGVFAATVSAASVLADEKERNTLPFLLATAMTDREIVFGKLAARVGMIGLVLLTALPVLAIMQFMGGVDPHLLLAAFATTGAAMVSAACVAAVVSIAAPSVKQATAGALGVLFLYYFGGSVGGMILMRLGYGGIRLCPTTNGWYCLGDAIQLLNQGNPFWVVLPRLAFGAPLADLLGTVLVDLLIFHAVVSTVAIGWSAFRLRRIIAKQADRGAGKISNSTARTMLAGGRRRPVFERRPVLWRETCTTVGKFGSKPLVVWIKRLIFVGTFAPVVLIIRESSQRAGVWQYLHQEIHGLTRVLGTLVLCVAVLHIAIAAASSLTREVRQATLQELALTDLSNREILGQKAWAAIWAARWHFVWVGLHWCIDLAVGGLHPAAIIVWPVLMLYAVFAAWLGMFFAVRESPKMRAGPMTTLAMLVTAGLPWFLLLLRVLFIDDRKTEPWAFLAAGISPPGVLGFLTRGWTHEPLDERHAYMFWIGFVGSMVGFVVLTIRLRRAALRRFGQERVEGEVARPFINEVVEQ